MNRERGGGDIKKPNNLVRLVEAKALPPILPEQKYSGALEFFHAIEDVYKKAEDGAGDADKKIMASCEIALAGLGKLLNLKDKEAIQKYNFPELEKLPAAFFEAIIFLAREAPAINEACVKSHADYLEDDEAEPNFNPIYLAYQNALNKLDANHGGEDPLLTKKRGRRVAALENLTREENNGVDKALPLPMETNKLTFAKMQGAAVELLLRIEQEFGDTQEKELKKQANIVIEFLAALSEPQNKLHRLSKKDRAFYEQLLKKLNGAEPDLRMTDLPEKVFEAALILKAVSPRLELAFLGHDVKTIISSGLDSYNGNGDEHEVAGNPFHAAALISEAKFKRGLASPQELRRLDAWQQVAGLRKASDNELVLANVGAELAQPDKTPKPVGLATLLGRMARNPLRIIQEIRKWQQERNAASDDKWIKQEIAALEETRDTLDPQNPLNELLGPMVNERFDNIIATITNSLANKEAPARPDLMEAIAHTAAELVKPIDPAFAEYLNFLHTQLFIAREQNQLERQQVLSKAINDQLKAWQERIKKTYDERFYFPEMLKSYVRKKNYKNTGVLKNNLTLPPNAIQYLVEVLPNKEVITVCGAYIYSLSFNGKQLLFDTGENILDAKMAPGGNRVVLRHKKSYAVWTRPKNGRWAKTKTLPIEGERDSNVVVWDKDWRDVTDQTTLVKRTFKLLPNNKIWDGHFIIDLETGKANTYKINDRHDPIDMVGVRAIETLPDEGSIICDQNTLIRAKKTKTENSKRGEVVDIYSYDDADITTFTAETSGARILQTANKILAILPNGEARLISLGSNKEKAQKVVITDKEKILQLLPDGRLLAKDKKSGVLIILRLVPVELKKPNPQTEQKETALQTVFDQIITESRVTNDASMTPDGKIYVGDFNGAIAIYDGVPVESNKSPLKMLDEITAKLKELRRNIPTDDEAKEINASLPPDRNKYYTTPSELPPFFERILKLIESFKTKLLSDNTEQGYKANKQNIIFLFKIFNRLATVVGVAWKKDLPKEILFAAHDCLTGGFYGIDGPGPINIREKIDEKLYGQFTAVTRAAWEAAADDYHKNHPRQPRLKVENLLKDLLNEINSIEE